MTWEILNIIKNISIAKLIRLWINNIDYLNGMKSKSLIISTKLSEKSLRIIYILEIGP